MPSKIKIILVAFIFILAESPSLKAETWQMATRLYGDTKARRIGDILTVQIIEESSNSREASHKTSKKTDISGSFSFSHPRVDNTPTPWTNAVLPEFGAKAARNYEGGGAQQSKENIKATIAARVIEVLPNNNLLIEGRRAMTMQGDEVGFILTGTVRPNDISRENIIKSTSIADLNIQYLSSGSIASSQKKGIFDRVIDWVNPF